MFLFPKHIYSYNITIITVAFRTDLSIFYNILLIVTEYSVWLNVTFIICASIVLQTLSFPVKQLRIEVDCTAANTWVEIDAVQMRGKKHRSGVCCFVKNFLSFIM